MADTVDKATRSRYMAAVKSRGNISTEARMVALLREHKLSGWRRHLPLPGTPDFCWPKLKLAVFVDGCFWHGCIHCGKASKSNLGYWQAKVASNRRRDVRATAELRSRGWTVIRIWECRLKRNPDQCISRIKKAIKKGSKLRTLRLGSAACLQ